MDSIQIRFIFLELRVIILGSCLILCQLLNYIMLQHSVVNVHLDQTLNVFQVTSANTTVVFLV